MQRKRVNFTRLAAKRINHHSIHIPVKSRDPIFPKLWQRKARNFMGMTFLWYLIPMVCSQVDPNHMFSTAVSFLTSSDMALDNCHVLHF